MPVVLFLAISVYTNSQDLSSSKNTLTVVFYNVENLSGIHNDPGTDDQSYTPEGPKQWDQEKYKKKIADLAKVLSSINEKELPGLIGLAEVRSKKVLEDIVSGPGLRKDHYGIVHFDSKLKNGSDVALLFRPEEIELIDSKPIPVVSPFDSGDISSNIIYIKCRTNDKNICHVFVNHWSSRILNNQDSEIKRITEAVALRKEVDNILNFENSARIIIMGDFNDEPTNKSILHILSATNKRKNLDYRDLFNMMYDMHNSGNEGSVTNRNSWLMFDQIIVSTSLLNTGNGYHLSYGDGKIFKNKNVLITDTETGFSSPFGTYDGAKYLGGVSDHLPVFIILKKDEK